MFRNATDQLPKSKGSGASLQPLLVSAEVKQQC